MATADRLDFTPPPPPGFLRGMGLALLAHVLLVVALTYGLRWNRDVQPVSAEAELWSAVPQEAAPKEVPQPPPAPQPPIVRAPPQPEPPVQRDAQIAVEREKKQREAAERREEELERERDKRRKLEAQKKQEEKQEALERKKEQQARLAAEKRKKEEELARKQEQDSKKLAQQREENLRRMQGMAGTGSTAATGSAAQSSGPSASWGGRVQARVRPNIVFTDDVSGNPKADVEVRLAPDGTIVGKTLVKSSGVKAWDEAVLRALDKTETLPRDVDGRVPTSVVIGFRPKG
ncbi:cell envelope integrity protein TolA [Caenimonas sedimenti]|uniref:Cell envelope integrity protein TolA n=1 Tax=Caenimonas sedimenti TaxID=2596921 RepID=A0A562ZKG1_9BURK|nr:cell envelope integrity protein TolA [Caenimonas sedimenti]TWO69070.1 cell envelope integrity protein TolA [Caenimonas sedimenti]